MLRQPILVEILFVFKPRHPCFIIKVYMGLAFVCFVCLVGLSFQQSTATNMTMKMDSYILDSTSSVVYACDYNAPTSSVDYATTGMPCSALYTSSSVLNKFEKSFSAQQVESISTMRVNHAKKCFKVKLTTSCEQRWFLPNLVTRLPPAAEEVSRDECLSSNSCLNCEVSSQYPQEDCEVFTFGKNLMSTTRVFSTNVEVHQNVIGETKYAGKTTLDDFMYLGGDLKEKVYFVKLPDLAPTTTTFTVNPDTGALVSYDLQRILKPNGDVIRYVGRDWYVYDSNHLVDKTAVDNAIAEYKTSASTQQSTVNMDNFMSRYFSMTLVIPQHPLHRHLTKATSGTATTSSTHRSMSPTG
jgi:hypothetical protein